MKLNELKQGMVCVRRDDSIITIVGENAYVTYGNVRYLDENYRDDLTTKHARDSSDIMKVFYGDKVVWERKESMFWLPEIGQYYWFVGHHGGVRNHENEYGLTDRGIFEILLTFKTEEEALKQLRKQQATIRVIKEIARLNEGWTPNWDVVEKPDKKYYIEAYLDSRERVLVFDFTIYYKTLDNNLYLKSEKLAERLIVTHEQDLKIMLEVE